MGKHSDDEDDIKINYDSNSSKSMNDAVTTSLIDHQGEDWGTIKPKEGEIEHNGDDWGTIKPKEGEIENFLSNTYWKAPDMYSIDDLLLSEGF